MLSLSFFLTSVLWLWLSYLLLKWATVHLHFVYRMSYSSTGKSNIYHCIYVLYICNIYLIYDIYIHISSLHLEGYYFQFDYLCKFSYLTSNNFSWQCDNLLLSSSSRISACNWKMKISEKNDERNDVN